MKRIVLFALGIVFIAGILVAGGFAYRQIKMQLDAQDWIEVPAKFDKLELGSHFSIYGAKYSVSCKYRYEYKGKEFVGDTLSFDSLSVDSQKERENQIRLARSKGTCWINSENPSESVLFNNTGIAPLTILSFALFWGIPLAGACFAFANRSKTLRRKRKELCTERKLVFGSSIVFNHLIALSAVNLFLAVGISTFRIQLRIDLTSGAALWIGGNVLAQIAVIIYNRKCAVIEKSVVRFTTLPGNSGPVKCEIKTRKPLLQDGDCFVAVRLSARSEKNMSKRVLLGEFVLDVRKHEDGSMFCEIDPT